MFLFISELDFKKELQLEQERQRIQRELSQLDDEENVRGRENFVIEKKITSKVRLTEYWNDRHHIFRKYTFRHVHPAKTQISLSKGMFSHVAA